jgi:hypothetical protein
MRENECQNDSVEQKILTERAVRMQTCYVHQLRWWYRTYKSSVVHRLPHKLFRKIKEDDRLQGEHVFFCLFSI